VCTGNYAISRVPGTGGVRSDGGGNGGLSFFGNYFGFDTRYGTPVATFESATWGFRVVASMRRMSWAGWQTTGPVERVSPGPVLCLGESSLEHGRPTSPILGSATDPRAVKASPCRPVRVHIGRPLRGLRTTRRPST
jgi:hypothetical protein